MFDFTTGDIRPARPQERLYHHTARPLKDWEVKDASLKPMWKKFGLDLAAYYAAGGKSIVNERAEEHTEMAKKLKDTYLCLVNHPECRMTAAIAHTLVHNEDTLETLLWLQCYDALNVDGQWSSKLWQKLACRFSPDLLSR